MTVLFALQWEIPYAKIELVVATANKVQKNEEEYIMFENPGGKVKGLALGAFILESLSALITGIVLWEDIEGLALLVILGGVLVAYVTAILFYAFGEMVEATAHTRDLLLKAEKREMEKAKPIFASQAPVMKPAVSTPPPTQKSVILTEAKAEPDQNDANRIVCSACGTSQRKERRICFQCGAKLTKEG